MDHDRTPERDPDLPAAPQLSTVRRRSTFLIVVSVALTSIGVGSEAAAGVPPPAPHALGCGTPVGRVVTCASSTPGETWFTVPAGVRAVHVRLVGARGGLGAISYSVWDEENDWNQESFADAAGGRGAELQGDLAVGAGQTLHLHVGGPGEDGGFDPFGHVPGATGRGGVNGGGDAGGLGNGRFRGGAGGGASDLRVGGDALTNRVMVAGGGGGAGAGLSDVSEGGDHDQDGTVAGHPDPCAGGSGHSRRAGLSSDIDGLPGGFGVGGAGAPDDENDDVAGGGGGGGYGGGGGGAVDGCAGGGGSSYFAHRRYAVRGTASTLWTTTAPPSVTLTYLLPRS